MKITEQIIDEIILKSPYGAKAWTECQKRKYVAQNKTFQNEDIKTDDDQIQDHSKQTYFNFEDHSND
ncbi:hypothetical protein MNB_SV-4-4 [hydrothermal vent metagenome]|uniref:Uncharacterized protein n=1 Tax=hydrothermal vent metagenome TaxID=652676 RepID=A0A1W1EA78_9ZZZZ